MYDRAERTLKLTGFKMVAIQGSLVKRNFQGASSFLIVSSCAVVQCSLNFHVNELVQDLDFCKYLIEKLTV